MKALRSVLFLNTHSVLNSGDAGIVLAQAQFFRERFPGIRMAITSRTPRLDEDFYAPWKIRVLPPCIPAPSLERRPAGRVWTFLAQALTVPPKARLAAEILRADLIIASGGGYFYSHHRRLPGPAFFQNYLPLKLASILKKPVLFFPQSFGPLFSPLASRLLRDALNGTHVLKIFAREHISAEYLCTLLAGRKNLDKVELCPDFAFLLAGEGSKPGRKMRTSGLRRPVVAMTLRAWDFPGSTTAAEKRKRQERYLAFFEDVSRTIVSDWGGSILLLAQVRGPGSFEDDRLISRSLWKRLGVSLPGDRVRFLDLPEATAPGTLVNILSAADLLVATRFHSAIFALLAGRPCIVLAYQPKSLGMMNSLGLGRYCLNIEDADARQALALAREILDQPGPLRRRIREQVALTRQTILSKVESCLAERAARGPGCKSF